jgi:acyl carrier protein
VPDEGKHARQDGCGNGAVPAHPAPAAVSAPEYHKNGGDDRAPATSVEQILAGIYAQVLGVDRVGVDESFFALGGDSFSAMRVIAAINTALDTHLAVPTLFDAPTVSSLSQQLSREASSVEDVPAASPAGDL